MSQLWPFVRDEVKKVEVSPEQFEYHVSTTNYKFALHTIIYISPTLPKRIELGDAIEANAFHLFFYMISRFYFFDNGKDEIVYYYPNKKNNYLSEKALALLPSRFKRETEKKPGYEYFEMPGCIWYDNLTIGEPWMYAYVRDLYKPLWENVPQVKGKYTYISRNKQHIKARRLLNEEELYKPLKELGFSTYVLDHMTFEEQIRLFRSSEIITGLHGAGMSWLIFCYPGTYLLEGAIVGGFQKHRAHYEDICVQCKLHYYRFTNTQYPDKQKYPDCVDDDCVVNAQEYIQVMKKIVELKETTNESKQIPQASPDEFNYH